MKAEWNTTDRIFFGVMVGAFAVGTVSMFIEACRKRPKVQMIVLGVKTGKGSNNVEQAEAESSSAAAAE